MREEVGATKKENERKCEKERNARVAMIKSSLLADLPEVLSEKRGKTARIRLASFYAALCLRPLDSYLSDASPFIFELSIPLSPRIAQDPTPLREVQR